MAITFVSQPLEFGSINDSIWTTASSTNSGTTNFKFVFDIKINNTLVSRSKIFPRPTDSYGYYNVAPVVRNYITEYFEPSGASILVESNDKFKVPYKLEVGEEVSGVVTTNLASGEFSGYNYYYPLFADAYATGSVNVQDVYTAPLANYYNNFLTERDLNEAEINYGDNFYISYYRKDVGTLTALIEILAENGSVLETVSGGITASGDFNMFNLKADNVNTFAGGTKVTSSTYGYTFQIQNDSTLSRKLKVVQKCYPKTEKYNLHFLNRLGGYDSFSFNLVNKRQSEVEKSMYMQDDWQIQAGVKQTWDAYNRYTRTSIPYNIKHMNRMHLISDWVGQMNYAWLYQLIASPIVYVDVQSMYIPCNITTNSYDFKLNNSDKLFNLEIDIEFAKTIISQ